MTKVAEEAILLRCESHNRAVLSALGEAVVVLVALMHASDFNMLTLDGPRAVNEAMKTNL